MYIYVCECVCACVSQHLNVSTSMQSNCQTHKLPYLSRIGLDTSHKPFRLDSTRSPIPDPTRPTDILSIPLLATHSNTFIHTHSHTLRQVSECRKVCRLLLLLLLLAANKFYWHCDEMTFVTKIALWPKTTKRKLYVNSLLASTVPYCHPQKQLLHLFRPWPTLLGPSTQLSSVQLSSAQRTLGEMYSDLFYHLTGL